MSDLDLLVVVNQLDLMHELSLWNAIEEKAERYINAPITLIVHTQEEVKKWLAQGHYFFSDIQREGIVLYSYSGNPLPEPALLTNAERLPVAQKHFDQCFESAGEFLIDYQSCFDRGSLKKAAFELHQAAERFYSCLLLVLSNYRPKTHNIKVLHRMAIDKTLPESPLTAIFTNNTRFEKRCFELVRRAYIDARYSEHYKITQEELEWLFVQVEQLEHIVKNVCDQHLLELK